MEVLRLHVISEPTLILWKTKPASLLKEFWTLGILLMTDSETVMVEAVPYSNIGLTHCL